jgi:hypothetical protein
LHARVNRFVEQLQRIHNGDAWHGSSLHQLLVGITPAQASIRPIPGAHTVWELVAHIAGWEGVLHRWIEGIPLKEPEEGDFPRMPSPTTEAWNRTLAHLDRSHGEFVRAIAALPETSLDQTIVGKEYTIAFMLEGAVRHHVYHTGQIALLGKSFA